MQKKMRVPLVAFSLKTFQCPARKRVLCGSSDRDNFLGLKSRSIGTVLAVWEETVTPELDSSSPSVRSVSTSVSKTNLHGQSVTAANAFARSP